jgi:hypothetical protein
MRTVGSRFRSDPLPTTKPVTFVITTDGLRQLRGPWGPEGVEHVGGEALPCPWGMPLGGIDDAGIGHEEHHEILEHEVGP